MTRRVVAGALLLVAAVVAWLALREETPSPDSSPADSPKPNVERPPPAPPPRSVEPAPRETPPAPSPTPPTPGPAPEPPPAPDPPVAADEAAGLLVVDAATRAPLARATVAFRSLEKGVRGRNAPGPELRTNSIDQVLLLGDLHGTDGGGRARLPAFEGRAVVAGRFEGLRGWTEIRGDAGPWTLALHRPAPATVVVVDAAGVPCRGVTTSLLQRESPSWMSTRQRTDTDAEGAARFGDLLELLKGDGAAWFTVELPIDGRPLVAVSAAAPPAAPVKIVLPPTGRVRCEIVDADGAPTAEGNDVWLDRPGARRFAFARDPDEFGYAKATVVAGAAVFERVGLGLDWDVQLDFFRKDATTHARFTGPKSAGETVVVRLTTGAKAPVVVGRLVGRDGKPVPHLTLQADVTAPDEDERSRASGHMLDHTDGAGRFRIRLDRPPGEVRGARLELVSFERHGIVETTRPVVRIDLPPVLSAGEIDVGDVKWDGVAPHLLASGVIVDRFGAPIAEAELETHDAGVEAASDRKTDYAGRFRLEGDSSLTEFRVSVKCDGWFLAEPASIPQGATDARITMSRAGGLAGSLKMPVGAGFGDLQAYVLGEPARIDEGPWPPKEDVSVLAYVDDDGRFEFRSLRPGIARVEIRRDRDAPALLVVEGVEIVAGETTRDPRLVGFDPTTAARVVRITTTDAQGRPVENAEVRWRPAGTSRKWARGGTTDAQGRASVLVHPAEAPDGRIDVVVTRRGRRATEALAVEREAALALPPAGRTAKVKIRLAEGSPLAPEPWHLVARLRWADDARGDADDSGPRDVWIGGGFGESRTATFADCPPGRYRVELRVWKEHVGEDVGGPVKSASPKFVVVGQDGAPVEAVVAVDADELRRATGGR